MGRREIRWCSRHARRSAHGRRKAGRSRSRARRFGREESRCDTLGRERLVGEENRREHRRRIHAGRIRSARAGDRSFEAVGAIPFRRGCARAAVRTIALEHTRLAGWFAASFAIAHAGFARDEVLDRDFAPRQRAPAYERRRRDDGGEKRQDREQAWSARELQHGESIGRSGARRVRALSEDRGRGGPAAGGPGPPRLSPCRPTPSVRRTPSRPADRAPCAAPRAAKRSSRAAARVAPERRAIQSA